jgi:adenosylcobyric acid synthase
MSLNSWVTEGGKEIGMAQAVQAAAARIKPSADMNPVLLKPKGDGVSQVIVRGEPYGDIKAGEYHKLPDSLLAQVELSLTRLRRRYRTIVMEGAGGAAEINLQQSDIANLGLARLSKAPIILVGDIDRGGVFACLYGTIKLLPQDVRAQVKGVVINKFRGNKKLLESGLRELEALTGIPVIGVIPYSDIKLPSEDSVSLQGKIQQADADIEIAIIKLPHISNFTDFEPLEYEEGVRVRYVDLEENIGSPDAIILPGTRNTVDDLLALKHSGLDTEIVRFDGPIIGICGGFQMLGCQVIDEGVESVKTARSSISGLGLLHVISSFEGYKKTTRQVGGTVTGEGPILQRIQGERLTGYEIHMGQTHDNHRPFCDEDGQVSEDGLVMGTYFHGLFSNKNFRKAFVGYLFERKGIIQPDSFPAESVDACDDWAKVVQESVAMGFIHHLLKTEDKWTRHSSSFSVH